MHLRCYLNQPFCMSLILSSRCIISAQFSSCSSWYPWFKVFAFVVGFKLVGSESKKEITSFLQLCSLMNSSILALMQGKFATYMMVGLLALSLLSNSFTTSATSALVPSGRISTGSFMIWWNRFEILSPSKGFLRVVSSYTMTPIAQTSALASYG